MLIAVHASHHLLSATGSVLFDACFPVQENVSLDGDNLLNDILMEVKVRHLSRCFKMPLVLLLPYVSAFKDMALYSKRRSFPSYFRCKMTHPLRHAITVKVLR